MDITNPFIDYPVVHLNDPKTANIGQWTIDTDAILRSRDQIDKFTSQWGSREENRSRNLEPLLVAVKGDYGTGKTHLLVYSIAHLKEEFSKETDKIVAIGVAATETDYVDWYKTTLGPALVPQKNITADPKAHFLRDAIVSLYAQAGRNVAAGARMTGPADEKLDKDPWAILDIIKKGLMNVTGVEQEFFELLKHIYPDAGDDIRKLMAGLIWDETSVIANQCISGQEVDSEDLARIKLSKNISVENEASHILALLAGIHRYLNRPFGLVMDELEHLTRYDSSRRRKNNITWLKRLVEKLAAQQAFVFVAGHWSAWEDKNDLEDRFTTRIDLFKVGAEDVLKIVRARVKNLNSTFFGLYEAEKISQLTGGNMRRVLNLSRALFAETDGFRRKIEESEIRKISEKQGQRLSITDAEHLFSAILEEHGLTVQRNLDIDGIGFDLVAFQGNQPVIIAELKHAMQQSTQNRQARRFILQMGEVKEKYPDVLGCFIADGNIDNELLSILRSDAQLKIFWFDLTESDVKTKMRSELEKRIEDLRSTRVEVTNLEAVKVIDPELEKRLAALEERRSVDEEELRKRLEDIASKLDQSRDANIISPTVEETNPKLHAAYAELTRPNSLYTRLRLAFDYKSTILFYFLLFLLIFSFILFLNRDYFSFYVILGSIALVPICLVALLIFVYRKISQIDSFFDYSMRTLREIYIRSADPQDLIRADNILRSNLEESGPVKGKRKSKEDLAKVFPRIFNYLEHISETNSKEPIRA